MILLVHGHPFDHSMWDYQVDALQNFRLIIPDLKGYGKSDFNFEKIYIEDQALDLNLMLDELGIENVHLIGLSMGGQIISEFARLFPQKTKSLIICDSVPDGETEDSYQNRLALAEEIRQNGMSEYTKNDIHKYISAESLRNKSVYEHLFEMMSKTKTQGAVASHLGRAERRNNLAFLQELDLPMLWIAGSDDYFTPAESIQKILPRHSKLSVIKNSGHLPNMEQPEAFNRVILDFYSHLNLNI